MPGIRPNLSLRPTHLSLRGPPHSCHPREGGDLLVILFPKGGGSLPLAPAPSSWRPTSRHLAGSSPTPSPRGSAPNTPVNNPSLKGTVACKKDRRSRLHFVRRYPPDFLPSNYTLSPRKMGSLRRRLLGYGVPSQPPSWSCTPPSLVMPRLTGHLLFTQSKKFPLT